MAVDGSRLRAVNARDRNFTPVTIRRRMEQLDVSIARYLGMLDTAAGQEGEASELQTAQLTTRLGELRRQMRELEAMEETVMVSPDGQIPLNDPDPRAMASAGTGTGVVGYNLQAAVDTQIHIVVAHEVASGLKAQIVSCNAHPSGAAGGSSKRLNVCNWVESCRSV